MTNREIHNQRMRGYFIQATKEILKGEGLRAISVRNIARQAGYSYATLYNYFKDAKDLIFECVIDFQEECKTFIAQEIKDCSPGILKIRSISKAYIKYFIQYPGTYELLYIENTYELAGKQPTVKMVTTFFNELCSDEWEYLVENDKLSRPKAETMKDGLNYLVSGMLMLYLTRRHPATFNEFMKIVDTQLNHSLGLDA